MTARRTDLTYHQRATKAAVTRWGPQRRFDLGDLTPSQRQQVIDLVARLRAENAIG